MLGTSEGICISESSDKRAAGKSSFRQTHIGTSNVYNDEEHYGSRQLGRELERRTTIVTVIGELEEEDCEMR